MWGMFATIQFTVFCCPSSSVKTKKIKICRTAGPPVLYGRATKFLTLREEYRLRMFGNRVLRKIFGPKREEVAGGWRRLHNEELLNFYSSSSNIKIVPVL
jgi:hypothetical protein